MAEAMTFEELSRVPLVKEYQEAVRKATGIALRLVLPGIPMSRLSLGDHENSFCALVAKNPAVAANCVKVEADLQRRAAEKLTPQSSCCMAGLHLVAAPVVTGGKHTATWVGGQVFQKKPTQQDFDCVVEELGRLGVTQDLTAIKEAFFAGRLVPEEQFLASMELLRLFAQHLGENADRFRLLSQSDDPQCVIRAKEYIQAHITEPLSLKQVAGAVNLSSSHFCRIFSETTGFTLTEYVARTRVEKAKALLADASVRVSEVTFAVGFGSISQFNTVFRKFVGMSPTQYRAGQRGERA